MRTSSSRRGAPFKHIGGSGAGFWVLIAFLALGLVVPLVFLFARLFSGGQFAFGDQRGVWESLRFLFTEDYYRGGIIRTFRVVSIATIVSVTGGYAVALALRREDGSSNSAVALLLLPADSLGPSRKRRRVPYFFLNRLAGLQPDQRGTRSPGTSARARSANRDRRADRNRAFQSALRGSYVGWCPWKDPTEVDPSVEGAWSWEPYDLSSGNLATFARWGDSCGGHCFRSLFEQLHLPGIPWRAARPSSNNHGQPGNEVLRSGPSRSIGSFARNNGDPSYSCLRIDPQEG